jgi:hypothetical protein
VGAMTTATACHGTASTASTVDAMQHTACLHCTCTLHAIWTYRAWYYRQDSAHLCTGATVNRRAFSLSSEKGRLHVSDPAPFPFFFFLFRDRPSTPTAAAAARPAAVAGAAAAAGAVGSGSGGSSCEEAPWFGVTCISPGPVVCNWMGHTEGDLPTMAFGYARLTQKQYLGPVHHNVE